MKRLDDPDFVSLKFTQNGEIKPIYGLTCITWVKTDSPLFRQLCDVKDRLQTALEVENLAEFFAFLEPSSYHVTICDISASTTPLASSDVENVCDQIKAAFEAPVPFTGISAKVHGIGLSSTITALVHFRKETELQKVLDLESQIKLVTGTDKRNFLGHITLAYGVRSPKKQLERIREVLQPWSDHLFGELVISAFDLTCFTDMNTFIPLSTVDFATGQVISHQNTNQCQCE
jgi:hypothetical protein